MVMKRWISIDDVDWSDDPRKEEIGAGDLLKDYIDYERNMDRSTKKPDLISVADSGRVSDSDSLGMHGDLSYLPMPHTVGGCHHPIVLNNACSSWRALASRFSYGGASVYVGTTTDILGTSVGVATANKFVRDISLDTPRARLFIAPEKPYRRIGLHALPHERLSLHPTGQTACQTA